LLGEAVYLKKPVLAVPVQGQFEQFLNARYLDKTGYGRFAASLDDADVLTRFAEQLERCEEKLAQYRQQGNDTLFDALDRRIADGF
jgi:uncharacterized protein (TIGR00661 family)